MRHLEKLKRLSLAANLVLIAALTVMIWNIYGPDPFLEVEGRWKVSDVDWPGSDPDKHIKIGDTFSITKSNSKYFVEADEGLADRWRIEPGKAKKLVKEKYDLKGGRILCLFLDLAHEPTSHRASFRLHKKDSKPDHTTLEIRIRDHESGPCGNAELHEGVAHANEN